ncbi:MAG: hypothetical protein ACWGKN_09365 [Desulfoprunum sp.]
MNLVWSFSKRTFVLKTVRGVLDTQAMGGGGLLGAVRCQRPGQKRSWPESVVQAEKQVVLVNEQAKTKTALIKLFAEVKNSKTPRVVEPSVTDTDEIARLIRFPGWQYTKAGEREGQKTSAG